VVSIPRVADATETTPGWWSRYIADEELRVCMDAFPSVTGARARDMALARIWAAKEAYAKVRLPSLLAPANNNIIICRLMGEVSGQT
jgi:phosphopantetheinyl transferase (holo-ACP synthase)